MYAIEISDEMGQQLMAFSAKKKFAENICVEKALAQFFLDEEDESMALYDVALARLESGGPTVSLDDVRQQFRLSRNV